MDAEKVKPSDSVFLLVGARKGIQPAVKLCPPLVMESHAMSWNLGRLFSRPGKSWKIAKVVESHGK